MLFDENKMFEAMLTQNISCIAMFHNHIDGALKVTLKEIEQSDDINKSDKNFWQSQYTALYPEKLRETSFLLMFGHLEEMLFLLWRDKNPNAILLDSGYGIFKFKSYIKDALGDLQINSDYSHIVDAQKIRNSFLHIAGRISLSKDSDALQSILKNSVFYRAESDRIKVELEGLRALQKAISNLTHALLKKSIQQTNN